MVSETIVFIQRRRGATTLESKRGDWFILIDVLASFSQDLLTGGPSLRGSISRVVECSVNSRRAENGPSPWYEDASFLCVQSFLREREIWNMIEKYMARWASGFITSE
jgi:hypothetical protein